jgi:pyruvate dehydrogenase E1 component beta subunit
MSVTVSSEARLTEDLTHLQAINQAQKEEMRRDERVIIFGQGIPSNLYGSSDGLLEEFGPLRVRDTPMSEASEIGAGVGAAMTGLRPIVDMNAASFMFGAMDQIISQAAKNRYMFGGQATIPLVIRANLGYLRGSAAHHSDRPYPLFMHIPGLKVVAPSTPADLKGLLKASIRDDNVVVFFRDTTLTAKGPVPVGEHLVPLGVADVKRHGRDVTVVAITSGVVHSLKAAELLAAEGIDVEVIDPRTLKPLDTATILASVVKTGRLVIVDPANRICSAASEIAAIVAEEGFHSLRGPIIRVTCPDSHVPFSPELEASLFPTAAKVVDAIRLVLQER